MSLNKEKIKHVAKLARISVDEAKVESLTKDLNSIFKFIEQLNELNTDKVEALTSILNQSLRSRKPQILRQNSIITLPYNFISLSKLKTLAKKTKSTLFFTMP